MDPRQASTWTEEQVFQWHDARVRDDAPDGGEPVQGFGPNGNITLFLPASKPEVRWTFKDGKPVRETIPSCMDRPDIATARERVIKSLMANSVGTMLTADESFLEYAVAVIGVKYAMTDDDLTMLLNGTKWHRGMMLHVFGGEDLVEQMQLLASIVNQPVEPSPVEPPPQPVKKKPRRKRKG